MEMKVNLIKNDNVSYLEYVKISKVGCPERKRDHSLTSKCIFKKPQDHELSYVLEFKTSASRVLFSLIAG